MRAGKSNLAYSLLFLPAFCTLPLCTLLSALLIAVNCQAETAFFSPGRYLVKYKTKRQGLTLLNIKNQSKVRRKKRYHRFIDECYALKRKNADISICSPDFIIKAQSDPYVFNCNTDSNCLWPAENSLGTDIDLFGAWQINLGNPDVVVAVLDTGIDFTHPDSPNLFSQGANMITPSASALDDNGHGTHVSGIIASLKDNGIGIAGVAPNIKILPVKILDGEGNGTISNAIKGLDYVTDLKVNQNVPVAVINNSWGGSFNDSGLLREAFERANQAGILAVAAAGNGGDDLDLINYLPAEIPANNMIAVASLNFNNNFSSFSNFGANSVHLAAPGGRVRSLQADLSFLLPVVRNFGTSPENGTVLASGTSMSTPYVSGVIALMVSQFPGMGHLEIKDRLLQRVAPLPPSQAGKVITGGQLNAYFALTGDEVQIPTPLPSFTPTITPTATNTSLKTSTPIPQPVITIVPTIVLTNTPTPLPTVNSKTESKLKVLPWDFANQVGLEDFVDAKKANLLNIQISNPSLEADYTLRIANNACLLKEVRVPAANSSILLRLARHARKLKDIRFSISDNSGQILFERLVAVKNGSKAKAKETCKILRKNASLTGSK